MTDIEYQDLAESALKAVEASCDRLNEASDVDIDNQRSGGMVTLMFADQSHIVINLQKPLHEIWMAAKAGGFHYQFKSLHWVDTKDDSEFFTRLSLCASEQAGQTMVFRASDQPSF